MNTNFLTSIGFQKNVLIKQESRIIFDWSSSISNLPVGSACTGNHCTAILPGSQKKLEEISKKTSAVEKITQEHLSKLKKDLDASFEKKKLIGDKIVKEGGITWIEDDKDEYAYNADDIFEQNAFNSTAIQNNTNELRELDTPINNDYYNRNSEYIEDLEYIEELEDSAYTEELEELEDSVYTEELKEGLFKGTLTADQLINLFENGINENGKTRYSEKSSYYAVFKAYENNIKNLDKSTLTPEQQAQINKISKWAKYFIKEADKEAETQQLRKEIFKKEIKERASKTDTTTATEQKKHDTSTTITATDVKNKAGSLNFK